MNEIEKPLKSANMHEVVQDWYAKFVEVRDDTMSCRGKQVCQALEQSIIFLASHWHIF